MNRETSWRGRKRSRWEILLEALVIRERGGGFIRLVQLLIQPENAGLTVGLHTDKLSSPTLLPPF